MIPGRVLPSGREIAWHEAYHAAALCIAGMSPNASEPTFPTIPGSVTIDWGDGPDRATAERCLSRSCWAA